MCRRSAWSSSPSGCAPNAAETVAFFAAEDVDLKVLSGDAPATAGAIARDAGVPGTAPALDGEALPSEPAALRETPCWPRPRSAGSRPRASAPSSRR